MNENMTQEQRLDYLVEEFKKDSVQYKDLETPKDTEGKRRILRSLMNIRMPKALPDDVLAVQDQYLTDRAEEKGIVRLADIPEIRDGLSVWQGDITRLAVTAFTPLPESSSGRSATGRWTSCAAGMDRIMSSRRLFQC